jgi:hypothetical protein
METASKADTLLISCGGWKTIDLLVPLENKCKVPVVSSTPHTLMNAVRLAGLNPRVEGYGSVLVKAKAARAPQSTGRNLFVSQRGDGIDPARAQRRQPYRYQSHADQHPRDG